jgi:hypothetical protein
MGRVTRVENGATNAKRRILLGLAGKLLIFELRGLEKGEPFPIRKGKPWLKEKLTKNAGIKKL